MKYLVTLSFILIATTIMAQSSHKLTTGRFSLPDSHQLILDTTGIEDVTILSTKSTQLHYQLELTADVPQQFLDYLLERGHYRVEVKSVAGETTLTISPPNHLLKFQERLVEVTVKLHIYVPEQAQYVAVN